MSLSSAKERKHVRKDGEVYLHGTVAADLLGYSLEYVRTLCDAGELPGRIIGGAWYIPEAALMPFMQEKLAAEALRREELRKEGRAIKAVVAEKARHAQAVVGSEIRRRF